MDGRRNKVEVILKEKCSGGEKSVRQMMSVKLKMKGVMINVVSAGAPQVGK